MEVPACPLPHRMPADRQHHERCTAATTGAFRHAGATLFSWGLNEARLGRSRGDHTVPEAALADLKVSRRDG
eukprot:363280-Chlamydomonas_euryale.AAC.6